MTRLDESNIFQLEGMGSPTPPSWLMALRPTNLWWGGVLPAILPDGRTKDEAAVAQLSLRKFDVQIADNIGQTDIIRPISDFSGLSDAYDTCSHQTDSPGLLQNCCHV